MLNQLVHRHGFGEEPALSELHSVRTQILGLLLGLDTFCNHLQLQRLGHLDDVPDDVARHSVLADRADKTLVDLQAVHRELGEIGKAGIACTKIIDRYQVPLGAQCFHGLSCLFRVQEDPLCGLNVNALVVDAHGCGDCAQAGTNVWIADVLRREVHRHVKIRPLAQKIRSIGGDQLQDSLRDALDQAVALGNGNENIRADKLPGAFAPPQQGFGTHPLLGAQVHDGLV